MYHKEYLRLLHKLYLEDLLEEYQFQLAFLHDWVLCLIVSRSSAVSAAKLRACLWDLLEIVKEIALNVVRDELGMLPE